MLPRVMVQAVRAARMWACLPAIWLGLAIMPANMRRQLLEAYELGFKEQTRKLRAAMLHEAAINFYRNKGN